MSEKAGASGGGRVPGGVYGVQIMLHAQEVESDPNMIEVAIMLDESDLTQELNPHAKANVKMLLASALLGSIAREFLEGGLSAEQMSENVEQMVRRSIAEAIDRHTEKKIMEN